MNRFLLVLLTTFVTAAFAFTLAGCQENPQETENDQVNQESQEAGQQAPISQEEIRQKLEDTLSVPFNTVTFNVESSTKMNYAASQTSQAAQQQSSISKTTLSGELDAAADPQHMHFNLESDVSGSGSVSLSGYVDGENLVVEQDGQMFAGTTADAGIDSLLPSATALITLENASTVMDAASEFKIDEREDETLITLVVDTKKLNEQGGAGTGLLSGMAMDTLVVNYTIAPDNRISQVRLTGGVNGSPSYHMKQLSTYSNYDATEVPATPELVTEETVETAPEEYYYYEEPAQSTTTTKKKKSSGNSGSQGRAYFEDADGNKHYMDDPSAQIVDTGDGGQVYISGDGSLYFLNSNSSSNS